MSREQYLPTDWKPEIILVVRKNKGELDEGQFFTFFQDEHGRLHQTPEYIDYIVKRLGFGQLYRVLHGGHYEKISFATATIGGEEWSMMTFPNA